MFVLSRINIRFLFACLPDQSALWELDPPNYRLVRSRPRYDAHTDFA
jgi:hypothetical protein